MKDLDRVKELFLTDVDEETRKENEEKIIEWERGIRVSESFKEWQETDVTRQIVSKVKETYRDLSMALIHNRTLTDAERASIHARQDACLFILSLADVDADGQIRSIQAQITKALLAAT